MKLHSLDLIEINVIQTGWDSHWTRKVESSKQNNKRFKPFLLLCDAMLWWFESTESSAWCTLAKVEGRREEEGALSYGALRWCT